MCVCVCPGRLFTEVRPEPAGDFDEILCASVFLLASLSFGTPGQEIIAGFCSLAFFSDWLGFSCFRLFSLWGVQRKQSHLNLFKKNLCSVILILL